MEEQIEKVWEEAAVILLALPYALRSDCNYPFPGRYSGRQQVALQHKLPVPPAACPTAGKGKAKAKATLTNRPPSLKHGGDMTGSSTCAANSKPCNFYIGHAVPVKHPSAHPKSTADFGSLQVHVSRDSWVIRQKELQKILILQARSDLQVRFNDF